MEEKIQSATPKSLMPAACVTFAAWIVLAIFSSRCLYADGSHEFIKTLAAQDFVSFMWSRHFAFYIYEFPLVLAIKLGVTDLNWLRFAFGLGCFLPWPVILFFCHWLSPKNFWIVVTGCAAGYLNATYMAVGEHVLAHALYWPALMAILFARPLKPLAALILLASATGLLFSYESQFFLCLILAVLSFWRIAGEMREAAADEKKFGSWAVLAAAGMLFLAGSAIGLHAVLRPEIPVNYMGFKANLVALLTHMGWTLTWTILWICLMFAVWLSDKTWEIICRRTSLVLLGLALAVWGLWPLLSPADLEPERQYYNRTLDLLVPVALLPVVLILRYRPLWIASRARRLEYMAAVLLIVQSVWQIGATWQWQQDVGKLQGLLSSHGAVIPLHSTILATCSIESRGREFDWTWPCLSIALTPDRHIQSLVCAEWYLDPRYRQMLWQPFYPPQVETFPDLRHYGIDFTNYASFLKISAAQSQ